MAIPKLYEITLPVLEIYNEHEIHSRSEMSEYVANHFKLTEEERRKLKPSGGETLINNRCGWARFELKKAGLIDMLPDKSYKITVEGITVLKSNPDKIDRKFLLGIPQYANALGKPKDDQSSEPIFVIDDDTSPEEMIHSVHTEYRRNLEAELLERIKKNTPDFFEQLVVDLIEKMEGIKIVHNAGKQNW